MNTKRVRRGVATLVAALLGVAGSTTWATAANATGASCSSKTVSVRLAPSDLDRWDVSGWLCGPRRPRTGTVELLLAGATYDHHYWTTPGYSYVGFAARTGRTTFNVDRVGTGASAKPPADRVTMPVHAYVAGQLVEAIRRGDVTGRPVRRVVGVGHSIGAAVWLTLFGATTSSQARRSRPDAVVVQDFMHDVNLPAAQAVGAARYPAEEDPRFAEAGLPSGYVTTRPGTRELFYDVRFARRWVIERDERTKSLTTTGEVASIGAARDPALSRAVDVPTLVVLGANDSLYCSGVLRCRTVADLRDRETRHYTGAPDVRWVVLPLAGHAASAHLDAHLGFVEVARWVHATS